ncbi:hypothetical protein BBJ28_00021311 [Nothophytophthora sp. Chile5]|nr:hypothetical protein BBJ28_00021311 [Nothophytophthora sp. Chile5]
MKRKELLAICEQLIKSFDPAKTTVDAHATEALRGCSSVGDQQFLQQVLYGSYRYRELLRPLLSLFLDANSSQVSRADYTKFLILGYLAMFRLEELGPPAFSALALATEPHTGVHAFLSYLFNAEQLRGPLQSQWTRVLDADFVEKEIVGKMESFGPEIDSLLQQLHAKAFGRVASARESRSTGAQGAVSSPGIAVGSSKPPTVPVSPKLTRPRPRRALEPIRIPREVKANPVPASLDRLSLAELQVQQDARKERIKAEVANKYDAADTFQLATATRGSNLEAVRQEVERGREAELQFDFKAKPVPRSSTSTATSNEVKLTAAAILREDALHKRKKDREAALLRAYEAELRDPLEFYRWQASMQQQDEANWRREVETRRLEMVQAQFDAVEAAHQAKLENREVAMEMKDRAKNRAVEREQEESDLLQKNRQLTEDVKRVRDSAPREAEAQVREENAKQRDALVEFLTAERERKAREDAKEQAAREDLIRQIRALDRVHREHVAVFDPTETAQLGLLQEMSLAELRERLRVRHDEQQRWEEARRETILTDKQEKSADLLEKATNAARRRRATASANATARSKKKALVAAKEVEAQAVRRENNLQLAEKLQRQRKERHQQTEKLRVEAEELATRRRFLGAAKNMLEENHFDQLKHGFEREMQDRQVTNQAQAITTENVRAQEKSMRVDFNTRQRIAKQDDEAAKTLVYMGAQEDARCRGRQEDTTLRALVRHEQQRFEHAKQTLHGRNPYATRQSEALTTQARGIMALRAKPRSKMATGGRPTSSSSNQEVEQPQVQ